MSIKFNPFTGKLTPAGDGINEADFKFETTLDGTASCVDIIHTVLYPSKATLVNDQGDTILVKYVFLDNNIVRVSAQAPLQGTLTIT